MQTLFSLIQPSFGAPHRTRCMKSVNGSSCPKITITHLGIMGKVRLHYGYVTFSISGHFWTRVVLLPLSASLSSTFLCSDPVLSKFFHSEGKVTACLKHQVSIQLFSVPIVSINIPGWLLTGWLGSGHQTWTIHRWNGKVSLDPVSQSHTQP